MPRKPDPHIKETRSSLWNRLNEVLWNFPLKIEQNEEDLNGQWGNCIKGGFCYSSTFEHFKNDSNRADLSEGEPDPNISTALIYRYNEIFDCYGSISEYVKTDYIKRFESKEGIDGVEGEGGQGVSLPFDRVPLAYLRMPSLTTKVPVVEAYVRRRVISSLLSIAVEVGPDTFFDNERFHSAMHKKPQEINSNFFRAVRLEPCLIQTQLGFSVLSQLRLWDRSDLRPLGVALTPEGKAEITPDMDTSSHTETLQKALMVLGAIEPEVSLLKDREFCDLFSGPQHGYWPQGYNLEAFTKLRTKVFKSISRKS